MIIFTVKNKVTGDLFVGTTGNDIETQWQKILAAAAQDLDYPLYRQIRIHGEEQFLVEEWDCADNRRELNQLEQDAIETLGAHSLRGYKVASHKPKVARASKAPSRSKQRAIEKELAQLVFGEQNDKDHDSILDLDAPLFEEEPPKNLGKGRLIKAADAEEKKDTSSDALKTALRKKNAVRETEPAPEAVVAASAKPGFAESARPAVQSATEISIPAPRRRTQPKLDDADIDLLLGEINQLIDTPSEPAAAAPASDEQPAAVAEPIEEVETAPLTAEQQRQLKISEAIAAQKAALAARTQADINEARAALAERLTEFNQKALQLQSATHCRH